MIKVKTTIKQEFENHMALNSENELEGITSFFKKWGLNLEYVQEILKKKHLNKKEITNYLDSIDISVYISV